LSATLEKLMTVRVTIVNSSLIANQKDSSDTALLTKSFFVVQLPWYDLFVTRSSICNICGDVLRKQQREILRKISLNY